jgi:oligopeptide/dipeptide ABC transporter ATP-binding protein
MKMVAAIEQSQLLEVTDLKKHFTFSGGFRKKKVLKAVDGVSFVLGESEVLGVVGESGCGKTTLGRTILRLYPVTSGQILFEGEDISTISDQRLQELRGQMQIVFQDPYSSLNPRITIGKMLRQILHTHGIKNKAEKESRCTDVITKVGLDPAHLSRYPHEFSGGQRQRIAIARALILNPKFIVADEPTSALDMSIQAQILNLMKKIQEDLKISYLFITHNLAAAQYMSDRIAVMYLGQIVEIGSRQALYKNPSHPYTKALLKLCPVPDPNKRIDKVVLKGEIPSPTDPPFGCRFHPRCPEKSGKCVQQAPESFQISEDHEVYCHLFSI